MVNSDYYGHEEIVRTLKKELSAVSLFIGPESVGKWTLGEWLRAFHKIKSSDMLRIYRLTRENALFISKWSAVAPQGDFRLVLVHLSAKDTDVARNTLLKTLEESPTTKFILVSEDEPSPTIRSRSQVYNFGLLTEDEVFSVLRYVKGMPEEPARIRAEASGGQVEKALRVMEFKEQKVVVLKALAAVQTRNLVQLESMASSWEQEHTDILVKWCYEAITGKWNLFIQDETNIRGVGVPLRILLSLRDNIRPRLVVRAVLAGVIS